MYLRKGKEARTWPGWAGAKSRSAGGGPCGLGSPACGQRWRLRPDPGRGCDTPRRESGFRRRCPHGGTPGLTAPLCSFRMTTSGALFPSLVPGSRGSSNKYLVEFRAGKMSLKGTTVTPDKRKGLVYIQQTDDSLIHFCWKDRTSGTVEDVSAFGTGQCHRLARHLLFPGLEDLGGQGGSLAGTAICFLQAGRDCSRCCSHTLCSDFRTKGFTVGDIWFT